MTKPFILAFAAAALLTAAATAQTTTTPGQPEKQMGCPDGAMHNNMLPAIRPGEKPKSCDGKTLHTSSSPSSSNQGNMAQPDQGKPGMQTRPSGNNTTNMHTPGSENSQDQGPTGAPKT